MVKIREYVSLFVLCLVYAVCSFRYFPGRMAESLVATLEHILNIGPYTIGATLIIASILRRLLKENLPWRKVFRIFLAVSIILELFLGIADHIDRHQTTTGRAPAQRMTEFSG